MAVASPDQTASVYLGYLRVREEELILEVLQCGIIQGELPLERTVGNPALALERSTRMLDNVQKVHTWQPAVRDRIKERPQ